MVHGLASQLGGAFRMTSALREGTRVDLWLPVAKGAVVERQARAPESELPDTRSYSILLVDDEQLVRIATAEMLRELGHRVVEASNGADALGKLRGGSFDIIVTDYKMPRMTGAELAERARAIQPGLPVLLITGYTGSTDDVPDLPRLDKPFRRDELATLITRLVEPAGNIVRLKPRR